MKYHIELDTIEIGQGRSANFATYYHKQWYRGEWRMVPFGRAMLGYREGMKEAVQMLEDFVDDGCQFSTAAAGSMTEYDGEALA